MDFRDVFKIGDNYRAARARERGERQATKSTPPPPHAPSPSHAPPPSPRDPIGPQPIEGGDQRPWYRKKRWIAAMVVGLFMVISATDDDNAVEPAPAPVDSQPQDDAPEPDVEYDGIPDPGSDPYAFSYHVAHGQCIDDPKPTYSQAGTEDPYDAAVWLAAVWEPGPHREGGIAGCYDALLGKPARY